MSLILPGYTVGDQIGISGLSVDNPSGTFYVDMTALKGTLSGVGWSYNGAPFNSYHAATTGTGIPIPAVVLSLGTQNLPVEVLVTFTDGTGAKTYGTIAVVPNSWTPS